MVRCSDAALKSVCQVEQHTHHLDGLSSIVLIGPTRSRAEGIQADEVYVRAVLLEEPAVGSLCSRPQNFGRAVLKKRRAAFGPWEDEVLGQPAVCDKGS